MNITQRLRLTSAAQSRTATIYANTGSTNNYVAFAESYPSSLYYVDPWGSYSNATAYADFNSTGNPATASSAGAVTGYATDTNYQVKYSSTLEAGSTLSFDWAITIPSATQVQLALTNVNVTGSFDWKMEVQPTMGGSITTTYGSGYITNGTTTINVGQTHSISPGLNYWAKFSIYQISYGAVLLTGISDIYVDSYDTVGAYYYQLYPYAASSGTHQTIKYAYTFENNKLLFRFNTSSLGASATIISASLSLYSSSVSNNSNPDVGIFVPPAWPVTTYNATWYNTGNTLATVKALTTITNGGVTTFTIDPAYINKTGNTDCRVQLSKPGNPAGPNTPVENSFYIALNGSTRPYLTILYR